MTPRISRQARTQRPQRMQRVNMCVMSGLDSSVGTGRLLRRQPCGDTPMNWYMDCNSQTPNLGQPEQSAGWVARISCMAILRTRSASGA